jgi:hypothetical protein
MRLKNPTIRHPCFMMFVARDVCMETPNTILRIVFDALMLSAPNG